MTKRLTESEKPKICLFISHAAGDSDLVKHLTLLITNTLVLEPEQIRCTSVYGHTLGLGDEIPSTLAGDIRSTPVVMGVITSASAHSQWVLFELGAAWILRKKIILLVHPLLGMEILPGPLSTIHAASLGDIEGLFQALEELSIALSCRFRKKLSLREDISNAITQFKTLARLAPAPPLKLDQAGIVRNASEIELAQLRAGGHLRRNLHPLMEQLFGAEIDEFVTQVADAVEKSTISFQEIEKFRYHYGRMLEIFPKAHFLATSLPFQSYFWKRPIGGELSTFELQMRDFIQAGGLFTRIFFLHRGDLQSTEVINVLNAQVDIGVEVYTTDGDSLPRRLLRFFVVDDEQKIGWQADIDAQRQLMNIRFTVLPSRLRDFSQWFKEILRHESTAKYSKR